ncbi:hypothetical protein DFH08DRAFT_805763 [Mycena albidolilacea]|uniref:Uncharacterized protein n=1 Tax=Mycena albidolilacea TaxID=1033008 RepID=A0AAD7A9A2_9AGAR|nr:hypothetical protein DFH08DRAFT_805763 [Mycena albidolilacea]
MPPTPVFELRLGGCPRLPPSVICEGIRGVTLPKGGPFGTGAAIPLAAEAAVGVIRSTRAVRGAKTKECEVGIGCPEAGGTELLDTSDRALGFPITLRRREDPELEAGAVVSPGGAAISKRVTCLVEVPRLIVGFGFRWSKTGSEGPREFLDFADMRGGMSEEGQRRRAAIYALNRPVPVMSVKGFPDIEPFPCHIPESVLTRARAPHGAAVEYPPFAVVDTRS